MKHTPPSLSEVVTVSLFICAALIGVLVLTACSPKPPQAQARRVQQVLVTGGSMLPALHDGQIVALEQVPFGAVKVGDVVVFETDRGLVIHRVKETRAGKLWTKGDNNARRDTFWVFPSQLVGRAKLPDNYAQTQ